jgi:hypothetical protein
MNIPLNLNGEQQARVHGLLQHGQPDLVVIEDTMNGAPLFMVLARGAALDYVKGALTGTPADEVPEAPEPEQPPVRIVPVTSGVHQALPGQKRPT